MKSKLICLFISISLDLEHFGFLRNILSGQTINTVGRKVIFNAAIQNHLIFPTIRKYSERINFLLFFNYINSV